MKGSRPLLHRNRKASKAPALPCPVPQTWQLLLRNFRQYNRLLNYVGTRMGITIIIAVFFGTVLAGQVRLPSGRVPQGRRAGGHILQARVLNAGGMLHLPWAMLRFLVAG